MWGCARWGLGEGDRWEGGLGELVGPGCAEAHAHRQRWPRVISSLPASCPEPSAWATHIEDLTATRREVESWDLNLGLMAQAYTPPTQHPHLLAPLGWRHSPRGARKTLMMTGANIFPVVIMRQTPF